MDLRYSHYPVSQVREGKNGHSMQSPGQNGLFYPSHTMGILWESCLACTGRERLGGNAVKCHRQSGSCHPGPRDRWRCALTPAARMRAFLSHSLPKKQGKLLPSCRMTSLCVIRMARVNTTVCQIISKVITPVYDTCLAPFE